MLWSLLKACLLAFTQIDELHHKINTVHCSIELVIILFIFFAHIFIKKKQNFAEFSDVKCSTNTLRPIYIAFWSEIT